MGKEVIYEEFNFEIHQPLAEQAIALQKAESPDMLAFSIEKFQAYPLGVIAHIALREFVGFNAVIYEYEEDMSVEIGALYIAPSHRGSKHTWPIKGHLRTLLTREYPNWRALTLTNQTSTPINKKLGFTETTDIPQEAILACQNECANYRTLSEDQICCHTILELPITGEMK